VYGTLQLRPSSTTARPCARNWNLLDLARSRELIDPARELAAAMLVNEEPPEVGRMAGAPHHHPQDHDRALNPSSP
jgi:hypothetical protein